ncbi:MAG: hypothetical protein AAF340_05360 [Pseudomonadota bacterium]
MNVNFHLGAHRCAAGHFQTYLELNEKRLARAGICFWGPGRVGNGLFAGLLGNVAGGPSGLVQRSVGRIQLQLDHAQEGRAEHLIVTAPDLLGRMEHNFATSSLYAGARPRLSRLAAAFGGRNLRIGLAIRSYETFWSSALAERVARGYALPRPDRLQCLADQPRRWRYVVKDIARAIPEAEISVWTFEGIEAQHGHQFEALTGAPPPSAMVLPQTPKLGRLSAESIGAIAAERGELALAKDIWSQPGTYQPFDAAQSLKMRQDYAEDIDWLINGCDGLATYFDPQSATDAGFPDVRGRQHDRQDRVGKPRHERTARARAG